MIKDRFIRDLPRLRLSLREFNELLEYSASMPTGTKPGKRWKRLNGAHDFAFKQRGGKPVWMIGEYDPNAPSDDEIDAMKKRGETPPKNIKINWYRPVIVLTAKECRQ
ncbi:hypothetical protein [Mesorhizobium sp. M2A.F.Ca.ET.039.01.1.1]|uniref:hypothetical protein n=1 Tax=Mesorhizobium sp. M2A.F.Ca.ET.039.01.1.1 TaxID=2496746 RepID=UPI000FCB2F66|nr:hypothetical protein [Mesorhizobium sp. M2A.F.Ca.ET.039.01.1.1]RWX72516.1 hypothetical protein EOA24_00555 [Mesorhizobium sp. M2A.F.Ca.ET.039.01.1.1]